MKKLLEGKRGLSENKNIKKWKDARATRKGQASVQWV
jgi:hypothetical protein